MTGLSGAFSPLGIKSSVPKISPARLSWQRDMMGIPNQSFSKVSLSDCLITSVGVMFVSPVHTEAQS